MGDILYVNLDDPGDVTKLRRVMEAELRRMAKNNPRRILSIAEHVGLPVSEVRKSPAQMRAALSLALNILQGVMGCSKTFLYKPSTRKALFGLSGPEEDGTCLARAGMVSLVDASGSSVILRVETWIRRTHLVEISIKTNDVCLHIETATGTIRYLYSKARPADAMSKLWFAAEKFLRDQI